MHLVPLPEPMRRPAHRFPPELPPAPPRIDNPKSQSDISACRPHPALGARTPQSNPVLSPRLPSLPEVLAALPLKWFRQSPAFPRGWTTRPQAVRFPAGSAAPAGRGSPRLPRPPSAAPDTRVAPSLFHVAPVFAKLDSGVIYYPSECRIAPGRRV